MLREAFTDNWNPRVVLFMLLAALKTHRTITHALTTATDIGAVTMNAPVVLVPLWTDVFSNNQELPFPITTGEFCSHPPPDPLLAIEQFITDHELPSITFTGEDASEMPAGPPLPDVELNSHKLRFDTRTGLADTTNASWSDVSHVLVSAMALPSTILTGDCSR